MQKVALITGASSGIGKELARIHAGTGGDLVIVARRERELDALKVELELQHRATVVCIVKDLSDPATAGQLYDQVKAANIDVEYLINNAGFGSHGKFHQRDWAKDKAMIQLNVTKLTELTRRFLPDMVARQIGRILNIASTAGLIPGPLQAVYYATKAFVVSFSQAIAEELRDDNVTVTALCPGPVATEFVEAGDLKGVKLFRNARSPLSVAKVGYEAMMKGKLVAFNDWKLRVMLQWLAPFLPRRMTLKMSRQALEKGK